MGISQRIQDLKQEKKLKRDLPENLIKLLQELKNRDIIELKKMPTHLENGNKHTEDFEEAINVFVDKLDLAKKFMGILPYLYDKSGLWWVWNFKKKCYERWDDIDILNSIANASSANTINSKERGEILQALKQEGRMQYTFHIKNVKETWLQFADEIIDIETGLRFEASPKYFLTNPIPHKLGETEHTPTIDKLFSEWVGEEYKKTLYEILAYCLIPSYPIHRIFCLIGSGRNGKSCFLRLLKTFVGSDNCCSTELDTLLNSRFEVTKLHKKLVCQMGETNFNHLKKTSLLKKLVGQDTIGFEYKNKTPFDDFNYAKIIIATNTLPITNDRTIGFYSRWLIIDFPSFFKKETDILRCIPIEEYGNLALKSIGILMDLLKTNTFTNDGDIEERIQRFEEKSNPLNKFIEEMCEIDANGEISTNDFRTRFAEWLESNNYRKWSDREVGLIMRHKFHKKNIKNIPHFIGLRFKGDTSESNLNLEGL